MMPDSQRYSRFHHTTFDTFEKVDRREMQMSAASMAEMVFGKIEIKTKSVCRMTIIL